MDEELSLLSEGRLAIY